ncbi:lysine-N-methylase [Izhakiella capsodis]|uniref:Lysine-N-methylase n=1 Tax=Izhakiella capsodis TaxID=1367852 RepID=A0A1I5AMS2_9GAMM|nr:flagellin lysine-N-methylase [Izhakiella capsodis]SFN63771.1 lysine-N-methylase [Izhakiella capsodis]
MNKVTINQPQFALRFQCIGSACLDHCCKEWKITFDRTTVNRYLKSPQIEIKTIAASAMEITKTNPHNWATMTLNANSSCAFMDDSALCMVQKKLGVEALGNTCATYPRSKSLFKDEENNSLVLSCPEATRLLLTAPDAMLLHTEVRRNLLLNDRQPVNPLKKLINVMAMNLVKVSGNEVEQGLYALTMLMLVAQKQTDVHASGSLESAFFNLLNGLESGQVRQQLEKIAPDYQLQWSLLLRLQVYLDNCAATRALGRLRFYVKRLLHIQTNAISSNQVDGSIERLNAAWNNRVKPWLAERPHLMSNYLQYRIFTDNFPGYQAEISLKPLYLLTAEWYLIKSLMAATAELYGEMSEEDVIAIIYSFHSVTKHNAHFVAAFEGEIDKVKVNDDLSLLYLLK